MWDFVHFPNDFRFETHNLVYFADFQPSNSVYTADSYSREQCISFAKELDPMRRPRVAIQITHPDVSSWSSMYIPDSKLSVIGTQWRIQDILHL